MDFALHQKNPEFLKVNSGLQMLTYKELSRQRHKVADEKQSAMFSPCNKLSAVVSCSDNL